MFGRLFDITVVSPIGESTLLVDHTKGVDNFIVKGNISRFPYTEVDTLEINIYNLAPRLLGQLYANHYFDGGLIYVDFGYKDTGPLQRIFAGNIQRAILSRPDAVTNCVTIYAFDCGDFVNYGFFGKTYEDGYNMYAIAQDILKDNNVTNYQLSEKLKNFKSYGTQAYSGSADKYLSNIAEQCGMYYKKENMLLKMITPEEGSLEDVVYFTTKTDGKVTSMSGLIGIPRLTNDGLHFNCLINPKLSIYGVCYIDNSIISISQTEAIPSSVQIGATLATNGMYRIVKMTTTFSNNDEENSMAIKALAKDFYDQYTVDQAAARQNSMVIKA